MKSLVFIRVSLSCIYQISCRVLESLWHSGAEKLRSCIVRVETTVQQPANCSSQPDPGRALIVMLKSWSLIPRL
jgi:hypothetical protein